MCPRPSCAPPRSGPGPGPRPSTARSTRPSWPRSRCAGWRSTCPDAAAPAGRLPVFTPVYRLSALWAVALVVGAALFGRRWRLARDLFLAGLLAWGFGRLLGQIVVEGASFGHSLGEVARLGTSPAFPAVR